MVTVAGPSSVISKAFGPVSGPMLTSQVSRPTPGERMVHAPSVVNWPVPEAPVKVIWNESALATSRKRKEQSQQNEP